MAALMWAEIRRRWRGAAVVGLVLGLGFAAVLAAAAGARRTETAFPRMLAATDSSDLFVSMDVEDQAVRQRLYQQIATLDGVERTGLLAGVNLIPMEVPKGAGTPVEACSSAPLDDSYGYDIDRPNLLDGRLPRPDRSDEIAVTHDYAGTFGVGIGDDLDLVLSTEQGVVGEATADDGPVIQATIVGIGVIASGVVPLTDLDGAPRIMTSPALAEGYAQDQDSQCYDAVAVKLRRGTDVDGVVAEITRLAEPTGGAFIQDLTTNFGEVRRSIQPQVTALRLFAAAAGLATLLVVAQLLGRQLQDTAVACEPVWRALGLRRMQVRMLVGAPSLVTALVGSGVALAGAILVSGRFPIGPARLAEPDRGTEFHTWVLLGGALGLLLAALVIGIIAALLGTRPLRRTPRLSSFARLGSGASRPAVVVGVQLATGAGRGTTAVPIRSAAAGVAVAVAAVFATVTFALGLEDLVSVPERYGKDWDVMVDGGFGPVPVGAALDRLEDHPAVAAIAGGRYGDVTIDGQPVPTVGLTDLTGATFPALIDGRAPARSDEIVLGRRSLRDIGRSIGDTVAVNTGVGRPQDMTVVGTVAFPRLNRGSFNTLGLGVGALVRSEALPPIDVEFPPEIDPSDFLGPDAALFEFTTIRLRPDTGLEARRDVIGIAHEIIGENDMAVRLEQRPTAIDNFAAIRATPVVLAAVLGAMAAATLGHLVVSVARRRRRDLALCAALGMRRSQILISVVIQALLVAGAALLVGMPLGLAAGRVLWSEFTSDVGVVDTLRLPWSAVILAVTVVVIGAGLIATIPAMVASRVKPAEVLRAE